jgi:hypothetical protein
MSTLFARWGFKPALVTDVDPFDIFERALIVSHGSSLSLMAFNYDLVARGLERGVVVSVVAAAACWAAAQHDRRRVRRASYIG